MSEQARVRDRRRAPPARESPEPTTLPPGGAHAQVLALQRAGGNQAVDRMLGWGPGRPLPDEHRAWLERVLGPLPAITVHDGSSARAATTEQDAYAATVGDHIAAEPEAFTGSAGRRRLAHEVAHTLQQSAPDLPRGSTPQLEADAETFSREVTAGRAADVRVSAPLAVAYFKKVLPGDAVVSMTISLDPRTVYITTAKGRTYVYTWEQNSIPVGRHHVWREPGGGLTADVPGKTVLYLAQSKGHPDLKEVFAQFPSKAGQIPVQVVETAAGGGGTGKGTGDAGGGETAEEKKEPADKKPSADKKADDTPPATGDVPPPGTSTGTASRELTPDEQARYDELASLMAGAQIEATGETVELLQLFETLKEKVEDPQFSRTEGEGWVRFAKFLEQNKDKIDGILRGNPPGKLTEEKIAKIIAEFEQYIVAEPVEPVPGALTTPEDYDKEFKYDPGWQKLSKEDRRLLLDYAKMNPSEISDDKVDFTKVTTQMKVSMALKLTDKWAPAVAEAAKAAFTDPTFVITLVAVTGFYFYLWLTPDPSFATKVVAAGITIYMWSQFAWHDIIGTARAWVALNDECKAATNVAELKAAGDTFATKIGSVGFDIIMLLVMWRIGKKVGPKLQESAANRGVARAQAEVAAAEAKPGSGSKAAATPETAKILDTAKAQAKGSTATAVLEALEKLLSPEARAGLASLRKTLAGKGAEGSGDMAVVKALEARAAKGENISKFLTDKGATPAQAETAKAALDQAQLKLARAKLIQAETIKDPALRKTARSEQFRAIKLLLQRLGVLDSTGVKEAIKKGDVGALKTALSEALAKLDTRVPSNETKGSLGEALQKASLEIQYPSGKGFRILRNLAIVAEVAGFKSLAEWRAAREAAIRAADSTLSAEAVQKQLSGEMGKLFEKNGRVYEAQGEIDTLVTEPGTAGKLRPVELSEAKSGGEKPIRAMAQIEKALDALRAIASKQANNRVFELSGKNELGNELTPKLDLSALGTVRKSTYGPEGKGFTNSLGFTEAELGALADSLLKSLPPGDPTVIPVTSPEQEKEEDALKAPESR